MCVLSDADDRCAVDDSAAGRHRATLAILKPSGAASYMQWPAGRLLVINSFHTDFLEVYFGLSQLVTVLSHGSNIIDRLYTSRPDLFHVDVFSSLIRTKHRADVHVWQPAANINGRSPVINCYDQERFLYDLRANNIDSLRHAPCSQYNIAIQFY